MKFSRALLLIIALPASALDWKDPRAVVAAALDNHPTLLRLQTEVAAARERVEPAASLPNPMAMAGVQNAEIDFDNDPMMTMYMVGAQQTFTNGAKRRARRTAAELEVRALEQQVEAARAAIERDALLAWYDTAAADSQIAVAGQVRLLIDAMIDAARVRYEVGSAVQAEVIRAQLERSNLEHRIVALRGARNAAVARLLPIVGLPPGSEVPPLHLPHATAARALPDDVIVPDEHPALVALEAEIARQDELVALARLAERPDIALEASYGHRRDQTDMFSVVASIELPLRRRSLIEPRIREAVARREAAARRIEEVRREIEQALAVAAANHDEATQQLQLHEEVLVPQARLAVESTLASYQTGATSFESVMNAESTYLRLSLDHYEYLARHIKSIVDYEAIREGAGARMSSPAPAPAPQMGGM